MDLEYDQPTARWTSIKANGAHFLPRVS